MYTQVQATDDRRILFREATDARLEIAWTGSDGVRHSLRGEARDSSAIGLSGVFPDSVPEGQLLSIRLKPSEFRGLGVVRYSTPIAGGFLIGIALKGKLRPT
jgi:hypothetical protein